MFPPGSPEYWRELVTSIYKEHNPAKLGDVDTLPTKYRGRERTLYLGICEKYKVAPTFGEGPAQPPIPGPPGSDGASKPPPTSSPETVAKFKELICDIYRE